MTRQNHKTQKVTEEPLFLRLLVCVVWYCTFNISAGVRCEIVHT